MAILMGIGMGVLIRNLMEMFIGSFMRILKGILMENFDGHFNGIFLF